jgi:hypothetical protein
MRMRSGFEMAVAHRSFGNCLTVETSAPVKTANSASVLSTWKCSLQSGRSSEQLHHSPCKKHGAVITASSAGIFMHDLVKIGTWEI